MTFYSKVVVFRKKSIPAPILIPDTGRRIPKVQVQAGYSVAPSAVPPLEKSHPNANHASLSPSSPTSDNLSVISGTTLAHVLIGSSFGLSPIDRRSLRYRSGLARQDSATLPRSEVGFVPDTGRSSTIPPVPQVHTMLASPKPNRSSTSKSGASTESEYPTQDSYIAPPETVVGSVIPQQASRTQEISSLTASTSPKAPFSAVSGTTPQQLRAGSVLRTRVAKKTSSAFNGIETAVELPVPLSTQEATQHSSQEGSIVLGYDHGLDEFDFVPPEPLAATSSAGSDSSTSYITPLPKRSDANRGQQRRKVGGLTLVRNGCMMDSFSRFKFESKNFLTAKDTTNSLADSIPASHQGHGIPSAAVSEHDYGELHYYDVTLRPESSASSHDPSSGSAGYQTFPETPGLSPLWSSEYALLAKSDTQLLRRRTSSTKSTGLGSGRSYSSRRAARRQLDNNGRAGGATVLHRSRSSVLSGQKMSSQKRHESKASSSAQVDDKTGIPDETNQSSTTNTVDSQNCVKVRSAVRPHPLARISSSSSCFLEEEALQALGPHSASSLPSIVIDGVDTLLNPTTVPAPIADSTIKSPTSVPLPEPTDESPFNSPALDDGVTAASPSTSPVKPSVPTTTATVTSPLPSKTPLSASSSVGSSFLPSPSPPASLNESFLQPLSPMPLVSSPAALDDLVFPSPSSAPPPPYHSVVSERTAHHPSSTSTPPLSQKSSGEHNHQRSRQASNASAGSGSVRGRGRARPPLPIGPRKPSGPGQVPSSFVPGARDRNGSMSSAGSGGPAGNPGSLWRKLQSAVSKPPPRFQPPPPKWRGLTLEAAQWTFTSAQLQEMVSQAIRQASDGSSLRLLRLEILEGEIADEMHRLELQHTDVKAQYKALVRKRWTLMGVLAGHIEGVEMTDVTTGSRTMEELAEVLLALDRLADKMHGIVLQIGHLKSLRDVHHASALAMAVRKINGLFIRQTAEKERLQGRVDALQTERDEAWKHAEGIAQDYDTLNDRVAETPRASESRDVKINADAQTAAVSKCSERLSAKRKSTTRLSQAGLRSRSKNRSGPSSATTTRPTSLALDDIPPVPRLRVKPLSIRSTTLPISTGTASFLVSFLLFTLRTRTEPVSSVSYRRYTV